MAQRARPRDLYDIINLFRRNDLRLYPDVIRQALVEKCAAKELDVPTASDFVDSPLIAALEADWSQMLGHQLPALPPLEGFFDELPLLFAWLEGTAEFEELAPLPGGTDEGDWSPPPTVTTWRTGIPLETVRFAATNHLCVELLYDGSWRRIEPYSLRRSSSGRLLLHAERSDGEGHRTYGVDKIGGLRVTTVPFRPRYPIEFSAHGPLHAPPQSRNPAAGKAAFDERRHARRPDPFTSTSARGAARSFATPSATQLCAPTRIPTDSRAPGDEASISDLADRPHCTRLRPFPPSGSGPERWLVA